MAILRQIGEEISTISRIVAFALVAGVATATGAHAQVVTAIVTEPLSGVAIEGYDPVSFFTEPQPLRGLSDYEYQWGGVPWYFASAANRDVFMRAPEVYAPQYGGHCLMSLSRGYLSVGRPTIHVLVGRKLYLFYSPANRDAFLLSPRAAIESAEAKWPALASTLTTASR